MARSKKSGRLSPREGDFPVHQFGMPHPDPDPGGSIHLQPTIAGNFLAKIANINAGLHFFDRDWGGLLDRLHRRAAGRNQQDLVFGLQPGILPLVVVESGLVPARHLLAAIVAFAIEQIGPQDGARQGGPPL